LKYGLKVTLKKEEKARRAKFDLDEVNKKMYLEKHGEERDVKI